MSKNKKGGYGGLIFICFLIMVVGIAMLVFGYFLPDVLKNDIVVKIFKYGGWALAGLGLLLFIVALAKSSSSKKKAATSQVTSAPVEVAHADESKVRYIPSENVYQFVNMGDRQSIEEKFNEIAHMDQTQFVIYVARLFSRKGYQVKFTPVIDNYGIDLLVEKMGVIIAVSCRLCGKVLCESDIRNVVEGARHYPVSNSMVLTNMYFDRTALEFAKREKMSLVDRNILAEDFMR